jgi:hypothetical protein
MCLLLCGRYTRKQIVQQPRDRSSNSNTKGWLIAQLIYIYYYTKENYIWCICGSSNKMTTQFAEFLLQMYMDKQMIITAVDNDTLIFKRLVLLLNVILTINNNIYCCRYQTTDVITSCTLIVPCLVPVYIR